MRENKGHLLIRNTLTTPGACFCTFILHVRENKGHLLIRNTLITPGDCFCTFIRHVRGNKGIRNTLITPSSWFRAFIFSLTCRINVQKQAPGVIRVFRMGICPIFSITCRINVQNNHQGIVRALINVHNFGKFFYGLAFSTICYTSSKDSHIQILLHFNVKYVS